MMGVYNILYMIERGELSEDLREKSLVTYVAGLFRSIRFMTITRPGVDIGMHRNHFLEFSSPCLFSSNRSSGSGSVCVSVHVSVTFMNSSLNFHVSGSDL